MCWETMYSRKNQTELLKNAHAITDLTEIEKQEVERLEDAKQMAYEQLCEELGTEIFPDLQIPEMQSRIASRFGVQPDQVEIESLYKNPENAMPYDFSGFIAIHQIPDQVALEQAVIQSQIHEISVHRACVLDDDPDLCDENNDHYSLYDRVTDAKKYTRNLVEAVETLNDSYGYHRREHDAMYLSFSCGKLISLMFGHVIFQNDQVPYIYHLMWEPREALSYVDSKEPETDIQYNYDYFPVCYEPVSLSGLSMGDLGLSTERLLDVADHYDEFSSELLRLYKQTVLPIVRIGFDNILRDMVHGDRPVPVPSCPLPPPLFTVPTREEFEKAVYWERLQKAHEQQVKNAGQLAQNYENLMRNERPWAK